MQADQFDQLLEQITITNKWMNIQKWGQGDTDIGNNHKIVAAERRRGKLFFFGTTSKDAEGATNTNIW